MRTKLIFALSGAGILAGCVAAYLFGLQKPQLPPAFPPPADSYLSGIYAEGIVESTQRSGEDINMYPEVAGTVKQIFVTEGQAVRKGMPLLLIDDSIQRAAETSLDVRCYVDEILVPRLPPVSKIKAEMSIRGINYKLPLTFVREQPFVSPKIELSDERAERVDRPGFTDHFPLQQTQGRESLPR
jgi:multidrug efflux pump subunit AcrA (membrane-fusion protein)